MERQYVGARYVPRFVGEYDETQIYEGLDVVDNGMGTSYIARKPVPAGTPLTNTEYWFIYGASSGAIIQLQNDMTEVQNDIEDINDDIDDINDKMERELLVLGNSYSDYGCTDKLGALFNKYYRRNGSGSGFLTYTSHSTTFIDQLDTAIADATIDKNKITDILFCSAMGDTRAFTEDSSNFNSRLQTALASAQTKIANNFPNVKRVMITFAETRSVPYFSDNDYNALFTVHRLFKILAPSYNMEYIGWTGFDSLFVASDLSSDNYHPSTEGTSKIGERIKQAYLGHIEYMVKQSVGSVPFRYTSAGTITLIVQFTPDKTQIECRIGSVTNGASVTLTANDTFITTASLSMPAPAPLYNGVNLYAHLCHGSNGTQLDFLCLSLERDTHGEAKLRNVYAPLASTAGHSQIVMPEFCLIDYFNC